MDMCGFNTWMFKNPARTVTWNKFHDMKDLAGGVGMFKTSIDIRHNWNNSDAAISNDRENITYTYQNGYIDSAIKDNGDADIEISKDQSQWTFTIDEQRIRETATQQFFDRYRRGELHLVNRKKYKAHKLSPVRVGNSSVIVTMQPMEVTQVWWCRFNHTIMDDPMQFKATITVKDRWTQQNWETSDDKRNPHGDGSYFYQDDKWYKHEKGLNPYMFRIMLIIPYTFQPRVLQVP